ncbi:Por secretion system C-terminal sorting domain-containing protein [Dyadobacter soli]|uniref:Por secretion system C-terminal sorting domain-containing protein n=1 Tax=Dyadobacter soli TaxID=659014 RepID=A0A1G7GM08_9BACT|nr:T9SS type A sorting domain-containing protein [Dyadobacter soli]SDE89141.1 Por secretion system C-terminal sorting domain-containing protein [Dyadobacter soli]
MKKFLLLTLTLCTGLSLNAHSAFSRSLTSSLSANARVVGEPVANDDISENNTSGNAVLVQILANDFSSIGQVFPPMVTVDIDALLPGNQSFLSVIGEGTWIYEPIAGLLTFVPAPGFTGDPTAITYTLTENLTTLSDQATVTVRYRNTPVATNDIASFTPGSPVTFAILSNDILVGGAAPAPANVIVDIDPVQPGISMVLPVAGEGAWTYDPLTGILSFGPLPGFEGAPSSITYTITDVENRVSAPAIVTANFASKPVANDDASNNNIVGIPVTILILDNDLGTNGLPVVPLSVNVDFDPVLPGAQQLLLVPGEGIWNYTPLGQLIFSPEFGFIGDPTPIVYTLTDLFTSQSDEATVTIDYLNNPIANNDIAGSSTPGASVTIAILNNDLLVNGTTPFPGIVTVDIDAVTPGAQSLLIVPAEGSWTYDAVTGILTFSPLPGFSTFPSPITYTFAMGANSVSNPATVTVEEQVGPKANDDISINNAPGGTVLVPILANDLTASGGPALPPFISVDLDASFPGTQPTLVVLGEGIWGFDPLLPFLTFTPELGFTRDPTPLIYTLTELPSGLSDQATVTVTYQKMLTANNDVSANVAGTPALISILNNDMLSNGAVPTPGDVTVDIDPVMPGTQSGLTVSGQGAWSYNPATGILTFTPEAGFATAPTPISYTLTDIANTVSAPAMVTVTYATKPVATDDFSNLNLPGSPVSMLILNNDQLSIGPALPLMATVDIDVATPGNQLALIVPGEGTWTFDGIFILTFVPEFGVTNDPTPITYTLTENATGLSDQATVTIQYFSPPLAQAQDIAIPTPTVGAIIALDGQNGRPVPMSGTDLQDGNMGAGFTFIVTDIGGFNGNTLLYNSLPILSSPFIIPSYDPSLLAVQFTGIGSTELSFSYQVVDQQELMSPAATYKLSWEPPLPVTLISFNAKAEEKGVMLSWATSEESNSDYFEIQRSGDGTHWQTLNEIPAAGLSSTVRHYTFRDEYPLAGQNLFRLKMVDTDKSYTYSQLRSVRMKGGEQITMSPNPVSDILTVDLPAWKDVSALTIVDQSGRKRGSIEPAAKAMVDMRKLESGIYLVVVSYLDGTSYSKRILVK